MHDLLPLLEHRLAETRHYEVASNGYVTDFSQEVGLMQESRQPMLGTMPSTTGSRFVFSDIAINGPGDQFLLAQRWGLSLPEDYLSFCTRYLEYLFAGRASYHLWNAPRIEEHVVGLRQGWNMAENTPHRLFPFARAVGSSAYFALRWSRDLSSVDVVYFWDYGDVGEEHLLGREGDRFVSDPDFTSWLTRMIATDGSPAFAHGSFPTSFGTMEHDREDLIRV